MATEPNSTDIRGAARIARLWLDVIFADKGAHATLYALPRYVVSAFRFAFQQ